MGSGVKGNYSERQQLSLGPGSQGDFEQLISHPFVPGRTEEWELVGMVLSLHFPLHTQLLPAPFGRPAGERTLILSVSCSGLATLPG